MGSEMEISAGVKKSRVAALLLSIYQIGFGHLYVLRPLRAALFICASLMLWVALFTGIVGRSLASLVAAVVVAFALFVLSTIDAVRLARCSHQRNPWYGRWYSVLVLALVFQIVVTRLLLPSIQVLETFYIPSEAMAPTLRIGDKLTASMQPPHNRPFRRGDLVLFESPEDRSITLIKRIVALPGDTLSIRDKVVFVNGEQAHEPWAVHRDSTIGTENALTPVLRSRDQMAPTVIPAGHVFVMGDNRDNSYDSRFFGPVSLSLVRGTPLYIYWSPDLRRLGLRLDRR